MQSLLRGAIACASLLSLATSQDFRELGRSGLVLPTGADWRDVAAGDIDGDGHRDLVFACFGQPGVGQRNFWLRNDGTEVFDRMPDAFLQLAPSLSHVVRLADFDGDGDLDAFFGNEHQDAICRNDGQGHLILDPTMLPGLDRTTNDAAVGDVDGDGDLDLVAACGGFDILYRNTGAGNFLVDGSALPLAWNDTRSVDLGDYDGDGDLDLLFVHSDAPSQLLWNNGTGTFTPAATVLPSGRWMAAGDVDGDGDRDLVLGSISWVFEVPLLLTNLGGGTFSSQGIGSSSYSFTGRALVDVDGDGDLDMVTPGSGVSTNNGQGTFTAAAPQPWLGPHFADIDGDGDLDAIGEPTLRNDGQGNFALPTLELLNSGGLGSVQALVDFDADGDLDALLSTTSSNQASVVRNDGRGAFRSVLAQVPTGWAPGDWLTVDLDGDGYNDLLQRTTDAWHRNLNGAGVATVALPSLSYDLLPFDGDGDGDLDLIGAGPIWYRNQAGGFVQGPPTPALVASSPAAVADVDGDQRDDVLWLSNQVPVLWRVTGNAVFTPVPGAFPTGLPPVAAMRTADFDGDGDVDVALSVTWQVVVLANTGGTFTLATTLPGAGSSVVRMDAVDLDADGDIDLLVQDANGRRLLRNEGNFAFVEATVPVEPWRGLAVPVDATLQPGDVDGDGDIDLLNGPRVLRNLQRQLIARSDPKLGGTWRLEVFQRPVGTIAGLIVGLGELHPAVTTPFGRLRVDPTQAFLHWPIVVAGYGPTSGLTLPIPSAPALVGLPLYAQNLFADGVSLRLGNQVAGVVQ